VVDLDPSLNKLFREETLTMATPDDLRAIMRMFKAATESLGAPTVQGGELFFGKTKDFAKVVDGLVQMNLLSMATLFVKNGNQYVRVATTLKKEDGTSAVGTTLDASSPALAKLNNGEAHHGFGDMIFGVSYMDEYEPIKDASGAVIGAYFVGFPD
jgi:hypothetical protein